MRYVYIGRVGRASELDGQECDPIVATDGTYVLNRGDQLVRFADGSSHVVSRKRLRLAEKLRPPMLEAVA